MAAPKVGSSPKVTKATVRKAVLRATGTDRDRDSVGAPMGAPIGAKPCGTMTTDEETDASNDEEDPSSQVLALQSIEDH